jgi:hypothetical protein
MYKWTIIRFVHTYMTINDCGCFGDVNIYIYIAVVVAVKSPIGYVCMYVCKEEIIYKTHSLTPYSGTAYHIHIISSSGL